MSFKASKKIERSRVFICDDKFLDVRRGLLKRGWTPNSVLGSPSYDFKWRNYRNINFRLLRSQQIINHLYNATHLSSKALLASHLQGPDRLVEQPFFPRTWLAFRATQLTDLLQHLALTRAFSRLNTALHQLKGAPGAQPSIEDSIAACERYLHFLEVRQAAPVLTAFHLPTGLVLRLLEPESQEEAEEEAEGKDNSGKDELRIRIQSVLGRLREADGQFRLYEDLGRWPEGFWIVKPCGGSCGRDIRVVASVPALLQELDSRRYDCVVQKYIDKPLLLQGRKFDIRLWVLVTSVNPLVVWEFSECYLRLSAKRFAPASLDDPFVHLCNFAVQKNHPDYTQDPMWPSSRFQRHLQEGLSASGKQEEEEDPYTTRLRPAIRKLVADTLTSTQDILERRARGFEWLGLDIMVDEALVPWLIEVNVSPDVSHSTPVTKALVQAATRDLLHLLFDEGQRDGDLGAISSTDDLPPWRVCPELRGREPRNKQDDDNKKHKARNAAGARRGQKGRTEAEQQSEEVGPEGPCWRVWHIGPVLDSQELKARAQAKGSGTWEALYRKEKAWAAEMWGPGLGPQGLLKMLRPAAGAEEEEDKEVVEEGKAEGVTGAGDLAAEEQRESTREAEEGDRQETEDEETQR